MTTPKRWTPGDPLTAERLNDAISEAVRPRRDISFGNGSSLVNETLGNQSATTRHQPMKLVVAVTDFVVSEVPTDIRGFPDDVPSGFVREVRLGRRTGVHSEDIAAKAFLAYDPVNGLDGAFCASSSSSGSGSSSGSASESASTSGSKAACDVFYVMFNQDSKRWEVVDSGGGTVSYTVRFRIVAADVYCAECYATARVISGPPSIGNPDFLPGSTYDADAQYYTIDVYDMGEGWLNHPPEDLLNLIGHATWLRSYEDGPCSEVPGLHWEIIDLQDPEEEVCE